MNDDWTEAQQRFHATMANLEEKHRAGVPLAKMAALRWCLKIGAKPPSWVVDSVVPAIDRVLDQDLDSWDAAFGRPWKKGYHLAKAKDRAAKAKALYDHVEALRAQGEGLSPELFERVGLELGVGGGTRARKIYYDYAEARRAVLARKP